MWEQFFRVDIFEPTGSVTLKTSESLLLYRHIGYTIYTKNKPCMGPALETYIVFDLFPILLPVSLLEFSFLCMLLLGICVLSNVGKKGNNDNIEWSPKKKKILTRRKRENKTDRYTESRRAKECHSNRRRERKRESINYLVKVT